MEQGQGERGIVMKMSVICIFAGRKNIDCETCVGHHHQSFRKDATTTTDCPKINAYKWWWRSLCQFLRPHGNLVMKHVKTSSATWGLWPNCSQPLPCSCRTPGPGAGLLPHKVTILHLWIKDKQEWIPAQAFTHCLTWKCLCTSLVSLGYSWCYWAQHCVLQQHHIT